MDSRTDPHALAEAVANCDRDPIHIPGTIQSFGYLLATDQSVDNVVAASANLLEALGRPAETIADLTPGDVLNAEQLHGVRNVMAHDTSATQREYVCMTTLGDGEFQVSAHRKGAHAIIELIPETAPQAERLAPMDEARRFLARAADTTDPRDILRATVPRLRALVGYDRVKAYVFLPDGDGEVVAEARRADVDSFLGLRYPATDIPQRARELYASTPLRLMAQVGATDTPLVMRSGQPTDVDLSLAVLRGTDPVHTRYLTNMGVRGTLSLPIVVRGKLWGLFACHNMTPRVPDASALMAAELAGKLIGLQIEHALEVNRQRKFRDCTGLASTIFVADDSELTAGQNLIQTIDGLREVIPCDGIVMQFEKEIYREGDAPSEPACHALFALGGYEHGLLGINNLGETLPGAAWGDTAGALVLALSEAPIVRLAFLRNESAVKVSWAGAPGKQIEHTDDGIKLNPRASFSKYLEKTSGRCDEWSADNLASAQALRDALIEALGIQHALRDQRHRLGLLVRELNHRVRNILALVQSLSSQSRTSATSVEHYADLLERRIVALSGAHNLLTRSEMTGISLRQLAELELKPFGHEEGRSQIDGPDVWLRPESGPILALILHELTSNAVKYGALSNAHGQVSLSWRRAGHGLSLQWRERGGPAVNEPKRFGFGRSIIEQALPYEVSGTATLTFATGGVEAELWVPGELLTDAPGDSAARAILSHMRDAPASTELAQPVAANLNADDTRERPALVVEDNYLVAVEARRMLSNCGFRPIDSVSTIAEALHQLEHKAYDFCMLDVNLQGNFSTPIARQLKRLGTPFVFATGYGSEGAEIALEFNVPALPKPVEAESLNAAIAKVSHRA